MMSFVMTSECVVTHVQHVSLTVAPIVSSGDGRNEVGADDYNAKKEQQ